MVTDAELLRNFVTADDGNAFSLLVARYAPMVHGVALRCTGEESLADEVTQTVFTVLTRKAASISPAHLPGWLHKSATFVSLAARRKSRRYQKALADLGRQPNAMDTSQELPGPENSTWSEARPHLDEAISNLPEKSRKPVILHFFEGRSIREIASASGKSEDASRKELQRALERLSGILKRRGIRTTGAALGVTMGTQSLLTPPASAAAVAAAALNAGSSLAAASALLSQTAAFMTTTKTVLIAAVAVGLTSIPAVMLWRENSELKQQQQSKAPGKAAEFSRLQHVPAAAPAVSSQTALVLASHSSTASVAQAADIIRKALKEKDSLKRSALLHSLIAGTPPEEIDNLVQAYNICMSEGLPTRGIGQLIYEREGRAKGRAGMDALPKEPNGVPNYVMKYRLRGWAAADPAASKAWLDALEPGRTRSDLTADWREGMKEADLDKFQALFPALPPDLQSGLAGRFVDNAVQEHGLAGMAEWFRTSAATLPKEAKNRAFSLTIDAFTQNQTNEGLAHTIDFLKQVCAPGDPLFAAGLKQMVWRTARFCPGETLDLLDQYLPQNQHLAAMKNDIVSECVKISSNNTVNDIGNWLNGHRTSPIYNDVAGAFLIHVKSFEPEAAQAWANSISDPALREEMLLRLRRHEQ
ncbi:MAG TPA: sigma-70 family RNA polymerase sigma factor [Verrucomicrobiales bacterium]|nr:sigma-70 family RNA polymerase sigma factor [Verrucomicrobiales bacterium]